MASLQNAQIDQSYQGLIKTADNTSTIPFPPQMLQFGDGTTFPIQIADLSAFGAGTQIALKSGTNEIAVDASGFVINAGGTMNASAGTVTFNNGTYNFGDAGPATSVDFTNATVTDTVFAVNALETITDGGVAIKGDGTNAGKLKLYCEDAGGAHNVTLEGPAHAGGATYSLKFPNVQSAGTQILEADASGNLAWINTPSGGGGGSDATEGQAITPALSTNTYSIPWILSGYGKTAGRSMQVNEISFIPFYANPGESIGEFYVRVQTAQAGATMNIGLYKSYIGTMNSSKYTMPEYVADIALAVDVSTSGKKSFTGLNVSLPADSVGGCYWVGFQSDTAAVALTKWSNWVAAERIIYNDIYRGTGIGKNNATFTLPTGQVDLSSGVSPSTDLPIDFAWRYKS